MKNDPLMIMGLYAAAGVGQSQRDPQQFFDFMLALVAGGLIALLFSLWKSRKRNDDKYDTATWAVIATMGSTALAYLFAPHLEGHAIPLVGIELSAPLVAFIVTISATPFIEWILDGGVWRFAAKWIEKKESDL